MSSVCVEAREPQLDRKRQLAWQLSLALPPALMIIVSLIGYQPAQSWQTVCGMLLLALVSVSAVTDLLWCKIPNWITYPALLWAVMINLISMFMAPQFVSALGAVGIADCLAGAFIPFFFMLVIFSMTGGGAGDVKLTAAMGALLGLSRVIDVVLISFICAGGFALIRAVWLLGPINLVQLLYRRVGSWLLPVWIQPPTVEQATFMRQPMPLGPSFAIGAVIVLLNFDIQHLLEFCNSAFGK